jgi:adenylate cyclase, class 2
MSFEVEVKYRTTDHEQLARRLSELGALASAEIAQEDTYLAHPSRDFAQTKEALRIRRIGDDNRVTYKGPKRRGPTKTREEIEIAFDRGPHSHEQLVRLFGNLGFEPVAVIRKTRRSFHLRFQGHETEVALDTAEGLGDFAEVEAIAELEADLPATQNVVLELGRRLGLSEVEPRSYLRMFLDRQMR